ncbi:tripartite motif-containing protein 2-like [Ptychodera flava]|uniref:tripartite motif-containing protein 2-like n=1 Tax=Ptychodera flava TaxID=63121 RepID=UPI00396A7524
METATPTQPEMTGREGSEMETATPTQPEMTGREGSEMETATQPKTPGEGIRKDTTISPEPRLVERSFHEEGLVTMGKEQKKDSGGIFSKISKRIFGRKEKSDGSTAIPKSKQEQKSSVSTGGEEMPSGTVSTKMSGGAGTTGSKSERWSRRTLKGHQGHKFKAVRDLAFHNDKLLVCERDNNIVHILNKDYTCEKELGSFSGQFAKPFQPQSIAVSQDNLYFILDDSNVQIVVCNQNNKVIRIITLPTDSDPWCIALGKGFVIVTDVKGHRVLKYSQDGPYIGQVGSLGSGQTQFNYPRFVAVNSKDVIMVSDRLNHCIKCFDAQFNFLYQYGHYGHGDSQLYFPECIVVDGADHVYVCDYVNARISIWSEDGTCIGHLSNIK